MKTHNLLSTGIGLMITCLMCSFAVPTVAQTNPIARIAPEQGFTITPRVSTSIVLKTSPDAACDLRAEGVSDKSLRFYANADGYLKLHVTAKQEWEEGGRVQLDCTEAGGVTRYPLHLRAASAATADMPAPQSVMPAPKGSTIRPALTEEELQQLSNDELVSRGYPERPDALASPDKYVMWLAQVSRPMTMIPPHQVSTDIYHHTVEAGPLQNYNWSGYVSLASRRTYAAVSGYWVIPPIFIGDPNQKTYSAFWIGLDGYNLSDLVQAGTEQDFVDFGIFQFAIYYAWTELLPNQPTEQIVGLSPNPADYLNVEVWIGNGSGPPNQNGRYGSFRIWDQTQNQQVVVYTALNGTYFNGSEAEWIMERPGVNGGLALLSDYVIAAMLYPTALKTNGDWIKYTQATNLTQLWLYNEYINGNDNNLLSAAFGDGSNAILFQWGDFH